MLNPTYLSEKISMKRKANLFLYFILILIITSLACGALSGGGDAPPPRRLGQLCTNPY